eukprot:TRINITY_DN1289_c0_g1_i5.p1 TRINITY_DN1289_c0_g1~~TRINITY_DN1289_c0_g1_i5.p1  ORF type:complete len:141 (+),score=35.22 TRINITY_DN1289_c0_g1_i5:158-580(+)
MWTTLFLIIIVLIVIFFLYRYIKNRGKTPFPNCPPHNASKPIVGTLFAALKPDFFTDDLCKELKNHPEMFTIKSFFGNAVVLGTPKLAYEVMQKRNQEFVNHPSVASINDAMGVKDMLTILRDDEWRNRRSMLKHSFYWK